MMRIWALLAVAFALAFSGLASFAEVLSELGFSPNEIESFRKMKIV